VPSQQEVQWSQLKVGVLIVVAVMLLIALIFLMSGNTGGLFSGKLTFRSYFENSAGLKVGAPVDLDGVTVGNVKEVRVSSDPKYRLTPVEVVMKVSKRYQSDIRTDSRVSLSTVGVLGDTVINIDNRTASGSAAPDQAQLPTTETPNLQDVIQSSQGTIEQLNTILAKVDNLVDSLNSNKGSIGLLINDPALYNKALATFNQLSGLVDQVSSGKGSIGKLIADDTLYDRANATVGKLQDVANQIDSGQGSIGKLLKDPTLYNNLERSTQQLNQLLSQVNSGKGALGMMVNDPQFAARVRNTVDQLDQVMQQINSGQGTVGQLIKNPDLYNHLDEVTKNTNELMTQIRKDPKKYLTIHMKIF
jgi:phospholipid/cholesterol/gamma-HCH transport system substrate-binding protein